jgi:hypothetical protein
MDDQLRRIGTAARGAAHTDAASKGGRLAWIRETIGDEILGVPWIVPGYVLVMVVLGGLASLVIPPAAIFVVPGYVLMFMLAYSGVLDALPRPFDTIAAVIATVAASWVFWSVCAGIVWRIRESLNGDDKRRGTHGPTRLNLGKKRD